jgi:hypothetical protein
LSVPDSASKYDRSESACGWVVETRAVEGRGRRDRQQIEDARQDVDVANKVPANCRCQSARGIKDERHSKCCLIREDAVSGFTMFIERLTMIRCQDNERVPLGASGQNRFDQRT